MSGEKEALIIVVSAPSGSGKTTMVEKLLEEMPEVKRSISYTTRKPREGEENGDAYIFIGEEEFKEKIKNEEFLEWEENFNNYYGTSKKQIQEAIENGDDMILSIDVKGMKTVKQLFPGCISIFIMPPSMDELAARLKNRKTDEEEQVSIRLRESRKEIAEADEYDYLIVNKDLKEAIEEMKIVIESAKKLNETGQKQDGGK